MKDAAKRKLPRKRHSLNDLISMGQFSLVMTGYDNTEAANIIRAVFTGMALEYGGQGFYLPKDKKMQAKLDAAL
jgi:hypothetical protein